MKSSYFRSVFARGCRSVPFPEPGFVSLLLEGWNSRDRTCVVSVLNLCCADRCRPSGPVPAGRITCCLCFSLDSGSLRWCWNGGDVSGPRTRTNYKLFLAFGLLLAAGSLKQHAVSPNGAMQLAWWRGPSQARDQQVKQESQGVAGLTSPTPTKRGYIDGSIHEGNGWPPQVSWWLYRRRAKGAENLKKTCAVVCRDYLSTARRCFLWATGTVLGDDNIAVAALVLRYVSTLRIPCEIYTVRSHACVNARMVTRCDTR